MRSVLRLLLPALAAAWAGDAGAQAILRSQTGRTLDAIQNQIRQAVRPHLAVKNAAGAVRSLALSPDGKLLAVVLQSNTIRLFDLQGGVERSSLPGGSARLRIVAISPDDRFVAAGSEDGAVALWDGATGTPLRRMAGAAGAVGALAFSGDGATLAAGGADGAVRLWSVATGRPAGVLQGHSAVVALAWSADGSRLLSGAADGSAILWNRAAARPLATLAGHEGAVVAVGFDAQGRAVTTDRAGQVRVWSADGGAAQRSFRGLGNAAGAAITPDGQYVVLGDAAGHANLEDLASGKQVKEFTGPPGSADYIIVDVKRHRLIAGGADGMVRIWNLSDGTNLAQLVATLNGWAVLDGKGRFDGSQQGVTDVEWVANQSELPIDNFSHTHYEPGLLAKSFTDRPTYVSDTGPVVPDGIYLPPQTTIALAAGPYQPGQTIEVTVTAEDRQGGIADLRLFQNGKLVPHDAVTAERDEAHGRNKAHVAVYRVALAAGANRFEALAASEQHIDGVAARAEANAGGTAPPPTVDIVTIGINAYKDRRLDLDYGTPDARAILAALSKYGRVVNYSVLDEAATRDNILGVLNGLRGARPDDEVVIYYAGHGEIFGKEWYLIPSDAKTGSEQDLMRSSISASELRDAIVHIGAERILVFIDACKSGGSLETLASALDRKVLRDVARDAGVAILAATRPDQLAAEMPSLGHGAFTYVVLQGLAGKADRDPTDGRITVSKILRYSLESLPEITEQMAGKPQVPVAYRRGVDFIVKSDTRG
jgi:WD40 repeat protein